MNKLIKLLPLVLLLALPGASYAKRTGYIVELIIFEDTKGRYAHSEDWRFNDKLLHSQKSINGRSTDKDPQYSKLNWNKGKLASKLKHIIKSPNYNVLVNRRWKQTGLDRKKVISIPINTKPEQAVDTGSDADSKNTNAETSAMGDAHSPANTDMAGLQNTGEMPTWISGQVTLIMSRYLHFNVDLHYFKPQTSENGDRKYVSYPVFSERRMKSKEVHYIDHPLVGVIVLATPYTIKQGNDNKKTTK
ncbi:MAG TPA: hypothetical protein ENJ08_16630 [Gammaproteobacteria bacterium]|nr:hypothetical protein [Gammaproteobacteria bacterium]